MGPLYSLKHDPEKSAESRARGIRSVDAINEGFGGFLRTYDVTGDLHKITAPTLVIGGRHDWICPPELSEEIARLIPHADLRIFENSSHSVAADEHDLLMDVDQGVRRLQREETVGPRISSVPTARRSRARPSPADLTGRRGFTRQGDVVAINGSE